MTRLGISVEGATEREFITRAIAPHLAQHGVYATPVDMRGRISLDRLQSELNRLAYSFDWVSTLYDFYGFQKRPEGSVEDLEQAISARIDEDHRHRVIPYVQRYEFETLVLAAPDSAEQVLCKAGVAAQLKAIVQECGGAERVNDNYDTCPSRRIAALAPSYDKKLHGPMIVSPAMADVRGGCPRFNLWLERLETLT